MEAAADAAREALKRKREQKEAQKEEKKKKVVKNLSSAFNHVATLITELNELAEQEPEFDNDEFLLLHRAQRGGTWTASAT